MSAFWISWPPPPADSGRGNPEVEPHERRRLGEALAFALDAHAGQTRKGTDAPYASHLLQVAGLVLECGGDVDQAVAALLHDTIEDCLGVNEAQLAARFGRGVARIVCDCTDTLPGDVPRAEQPWSERKRALLAKLAAAPERSLLVAACDKQSNLRALLRDTRAGGIEHFARFNAGPGQQLWYFESVAALLRGRVPAALLAEFAADVAELRARIEAGRT